MGGKGISNVILMVLVWNVKLFNTLRISGKIRIMYTRIAVLSDIHGNFWVLQAVLEDIKKRAITTIFNLGDSLYGPLDPAKSFQLTRLFLDT